MNAADILQATGEDAVELARGLWLASRLKTTESVKGLEALDAHPTQSVRFFARCAARFFSSRRGLACPPCVDPGSPRPRLGPPLVEAHGTRTYEVGWSSLVDLAKNDPGWRNPPKVITCRVCASAQTDSRYYEDHSGTGWKSITHEVQCRACGAYTRMDISD
ncbi:MAG TPA: hypothetical protein ENK57_16390 [Polyangiaceae bacterium]|nr:hypothetical protein [Polyangiaceae bacterium]